MEEELTIGGESSGGLAGPSLLTFAVQHPNNNKAQQRGKKRKSGAGGPEIVKELDFLWTRVHNAALTIAVTHHGEDWNEVSDVLQKLEKISKKDMFTPASCAFQFKKILATVGATKATCAGETPLQIARRVLIEQCKRMNTEQMVNLEEEVDYLYDMKEVERLESGERISNEEMNQIILDTMYDEEGVNSDSESTQSMRQLRLKVQASQAGEPVSSSESDTDCGDDWEDIPVMAHGPVEEEGEMNGEEDDLKHIVLDEFPELPLEDLGSVLEDLQSDLPHCSAPGGGSSRLEADKSQYFENLLEDNGMEIDQNLTSLPVVQMTSPEPTTRPTILVAIEKAEVGSRVDEVGSVDGDGHGDGEVAEEAPTKTLDGHGAQSSSKSSESTTAAGCSVAETCMDGGGAGVAEEFVYHAEAHHSAEPSSDTKPATTRTPTVPTSSNFHKDDLLGSNAQNEVKRSASTTDFLTTQHRHLRVFLKRLESPQPPQNEQSERNSLEVPTRAIGLINEANHEGNVAVSVDETVVVPQIEEPLVVGDDERQSKSKILDRRPTTRRSRRRRNPSQNEPNELSSPAHKSCVNVLLDPKSCASSKLVQRDTKGKDSDAHGGSAKKLAEGKSSEIREFKSKELYVKLVDCAKIGSSSSLFPRSKKEHNIVEMKSCKISVALENNPDSSLENMIGAKVESIVESERVDGLLVEAAEDEELLRKKCEGMEEALSSQLDAESAEEETQGPRPLTPPLPNMKPEAILENDNDNPGGVTEDVQMKNGAEVMTVLIEDADIKAESESEDRPEPRSSPIPHLTELSTSMTTTKDDLENVGASAEPTKGEAELPRTSPNDDVLSSDAAAAVVDPPIGNRDYCGKDGIVVQPSCSSPEEPEEIGEEMPCRAVGRREGEIVVAGDSSCSDAAAEVPNYSPSSSLPSTNNGSSVQEQRAFRKQIKLVHDRITTHRNANIFRQPVREASAPGYSSSVKWPADMKSIKRSIDSGVIRTIHDYEREMALMFLNAVVYNPSCHEVHDRARVMALDAWKTVDEFKYAQQLILNSKHEVGDSDDGESSLRCDFQPETLKINGAEFRLTPLKAGKRMKIKSIVAQSPSLAPKLENESRASSARVEDDVEKETKTRKKGSGVAEQELVIVDSGHVGNMSGRNQIPRKGIKRTKLPLTPPPSSPSNNSKKSRQKCKPIVVY